MEQAGRVKHRGLTRRAIVERALDLGDAEGLEAVSLRRLATELGVTPMALYRHVKDKQDLVNAMYDAIVEDFDLKPDLRPGTKWTTRLRRLLMNAIALHQRPVALPLAIAYSGSGSPGVWRLYERALGILVSAGFSRREAVEVNRMLTTLMAGYLLLFRQGPMPEADELLLARKRFELDLLSLPRASYPNVVGSAHELVDAQFCDPQQMLTVIVDFMIGGVSAMLAKKEGRVPARRARRAVAAPD